MFIYIYIYKYNLLHYPFFSKGGVTVFGLSLSQSHIPAAKLSPSNGETTFLKAKKYETVQEKRRDAEKGSRGAPVPSNRTMLIVIAYGG